MRKAAANSDAGSSGRLICRKLSVLEKAWYMVGSGSTACVN